MYKDMDNYIRKYLRLAIITANKAKGKCSPNPAVGAVIVKNSKLLATGWTQPYGFDHAEVQALQKAGKAARGADIFVTLEPCSHYGKTPPCALAIIKAGIKRVFIGISDPNPLVSGKGIKLLKEAGIEVQSGFMAELINRQLESYLCYINLQRPFVTLKTALSLDGKFAAEDGSSRWITGEKARRYVHNLRSEQDVVLTGIKTVLIDDPLLNVRLPGKPRQPLRAVLDSRLGIPLGSKIVQTAGEFPTLVFCAENLLASEKAGILMEHNVQLCGLPLQQGKFAPTEILHELYLRQLSSVLLETGSGVAEAFIKAGLVDKYLWFYGSQLVGGTNSPLPHLGLGTINNAIKLQLHKIQKLDQDILVTAYPASD